LFLLTLLLLRVVYVLIWDKIELFILALNRFTAVLLMAYRIKWCNTMIASFVMNSILLPVSTYTFCSLLNHNSLICSATMIYFVHLLKKIISANGQITRKHFIMIPQFWINVDFKDITAFIVLYHCTYFVHSIFSSKETHPYYAFVHWM